MTLRRRAPGPCAGQGAAAGARAQDDQARCGDRARPCRFDRAETRLPRSESASQADAGQSAGARRVRGGRAGAGRGDRLAADGGRCEEPHRDARRSFPSRQVRRDHRPRRRAAVGCAGDAGARTPDRPGAARRPRARWSISGARCWKTRSARGSISSSRVTEDQAKFGDAGARSAVGARSRRRPQRRGRRRREPGREPATARTISPAPKARPTATPRRR